MNANQQEIVVAKIYDDIVAATSAKEILEQAGIQSVIDDMNVAGLMPLAGIELRVFTSDLEQALLILNA